MPTEEIGAFFNDSWLAADGEGQTKAFRILFVSTAVEVLEEIQVWPRDNIHKRPVED